MALKRESEEWQDDSLVPEAGLEPAQGCPYRILSPARLPFHHSGTKIYEEITIIFLAIFFKRLWFSLALPSVPTSTRRSRTPALIASRDPKESYRRALDDSRKEFPAFWAAGRTGSL